MSQNHGTRAGFAQHEFVERTRVWSNVTALTRPSIKKKKKKLESVIMHRTFMSASVYMLFVKIIECLSVFEPV